MGREEGREGGREGEAVVGNLKKNEKSGGKEGGRKGGKEGGDDLKKEGGRQGGAMDTIVLAGAYHGHTAALIEVSPYKYEGKGGFEPPEYIHKVRLPDMYRGKYRLSDAAERTAAASAGAPSISSSSSSTLLPPPSTAAAAAAAAIGKQYAEEVRQICLSLTSQNKRVGAFIAESILGCGGQVISRFSLDFTQENKNTKNLSIPPSLLYVVLSPSYLSHCYAYVKEAGGVCIVDSYSPPSFPPSLPPTLPRSSSLPPSLSTVTSM